MSESSPLTHRTTFVVTQRSGAPTAGRPQACCDDCCSTDTDTDTGTTPRVDPSAEQWRANAGRARWLSWISLAYMAAEGALAITAALLAGSVALLGFGLDSVIEGLASIIVIWRFTGSRTHSDESELTARRAVAVTFFLLAPYVAVDAVRTLAVGEHPHTSPLGIGLSVASLTIMPILGIAKKRLGTTLDSRATAGEGNQNLLCAYLAAAVLVGLLANTLLGLWWLDPAVALLVAGLAVREGREAWKGNDCC